MKRRSFLGKRTEKGETGMNRRVWEADFIASPFGKQENFSAPKSAPVFMKEFELAQAPRRALLAIAALGNGYVEINGKPLDAVLLTPQSNYLKTIFYDEIDVTSYLRAGKNVILAELGNGFYNDFVVSGWDFYKALWRDAPKLILELDITAQDGSVSKIKSDESFLVAEGGVLFNSIRNGETHDASKMIDCSNYKEAAYQNAVLSTNVTAELVKSPMPYLVEAETLRPTQLQRTDTGSYLAAFERNFAGYIGLRVREERGTEVVIRYGEVVKDGHVDQSNINIYTKEGEFQTDRLICSGKEDHFKPRHTYSGFRYAEISGVRGELRQEDVAGYVVHQNIARTGTFSCSNELFNRIYECAINASYSNMVQVITDCPTREKLGWTGDLHMSAEQLLTDFEIAPMFAKIERDLADAQNFKGQLPGIAPTSGWGYVWGNGPTFDGALFELPYQVYRYTGETDLFDRYFSNMDRYLDYLQTRRNAEGFLCIGLGDWSVPGKDQNAIQTPLEATDTLYFMHFLDLMRRACIRKKQDGSKYERLFGELKELYDRKYITAEGYSTCNQETLLAFLIALGFHGAEGTKRFAEQLVARIEEKDYFLECGIIGMRHLFHSLVKVGRFDVAYRMLNKKEYPSYGYWMENGNTTLVETWDDDMSKNHHMFSDVASFFIKSVAGISYTYEGGLLVTLAPNGFAQMDFARAEQKTPFGVLTSEWTSFGQGKGAECVFGVPEGVEYRLVCPKGYSAESVKREKQAIRVRFVKAE